MQSEEKEEEQPQKATKREEGMSLQVPTPGGLTAVSFNHFLNSTSVTY